ncbi:MAG: pyridoxamine kinase [Clostridia bacterium]
MKRVLAINDISCFGKCSLTVAIPIISAFGTEVCPLPTSLLSAHTGISGYYKFDLTEQMSKIYAHFKELNLNFDCVYSGYIPSLSGISVVSDILKDNKGKVLVVDPVMGDNGEAYQTHTFDICDKICSLLNGATIITPNITEAAIILHKPYPTNITSTSFFNSWLKELANLSEISIITGILIGDNLYNVCYDRRSDEFFEYQTPKINAMVSGTGDIFTSCFTACFLNGKSIYNSLEISSLFVYQSILKTGILNKNILDGIAFEPILKGGTFIEKV